MRNFCDSWYTQYSCPFDVPFLLLLCATKGNIVIFSERYTSSSIQCTAQHRHTIASIKATCSFFSRTKVFVSQYVKFYSWLFDCDFFLLTRAHTHTSTFLFWFFWTTGATQKESYIFFVISFALCARRRFRRMVKQAIKEKKRRKRKKLSRMNRRKEITPEIGKGRM